MRTVTIDGNEACSKTAYLFSEIAGIYPITPSSTMAEHIDEWSNKKEKNLFDDEVKVVEMQSEAGAAGFIHGALQSGVLATTFTASQGLLLMIPNMYKMAGEMLPAVIHVAARSISTHSLSIFGDHQDIYATRQTGFCMLASSSVQDASHMAGVAHLSAIQSSLPFLHFFDGFRTSHEIDKINILKKEEYAKLLDQNALEKFRNRALNPMKPEIKGTASNDDIYFQATEARNRFYNDVPDIVNEYMQKINEIAGTHYEPFQYYGSKTAKNIIIAMGSVCETIKETIDYLNGEIGLIEVHLYRPFSEKYLFKVIPDTVKNIAVLDRTKEPGSIGEPLYLDIVLALKNRQVSIVGGRYGLSSKNVTPGDIEAIYRMLDGELKDHFTIGIKDDVTNLSIPSTGLKIKNHEEILIYGYGSDGMVSASKSIMKLVGNNTNLQVQGYFEYDSKKSGGVTIGHLRFSKHPIHSTYYVENPKCVVLTKDSYLEQFDLLDSIQENGIFIISTDKTKEELEQMMSQKIVEILKSRNIQVYLSRATSLAREKGLGNKISMIMEAQILNVMNFIPSEEIYSKLKNDILHKFSKKGEEIIQKNLEAIECANEYLEKIIIEKGMKKEQTKQNTIYDMVNARKGNELPVSAFNPDGTYLPNTSKLDKRMISTLVPRWIQENCISCNQCAFVCPHSVIRPFLLSEEEYQKSSPDIQKRCIRPFNPKYKEYYFTIGISVKDCTGCGLCMKTCPAKVKALEWDQINFNETKEQDIFDYLIQNIKEKNIDTNTIFGCELKTPKFEFSGACAGCGETSYLKILTQLFGNELIIANATGCSSIYGASMPSMPYNVPWASSLFEDNAEYGYGILKGNQIMKKRIEEIMKKNPNPLFQKYLENENSYEITKEVYDQIDYEKYPDLKPLKDYIIKKSVWMIGGDGWAFDIGFSGIDHVLASGDDVNILVLNTQVYSNTGGQTSKATPKGMVASFSSNGKKTISKDLARIALTYPNVYVAQINLGANMLQVIKAMKEAENYHGPSIIIAYAPCISHGIEGGLKNSLSVSSLATKCGYYPIFRYNPENQKLVLDSKNPDFEQYEDFLNLQNRYRILKTINPDEADQMLEDNKKEAMKKYQFYEKLSNE